MKVKAPGSITLLHVSDMQFGKYHRFPKPDPTRPDSQFDTLYHRLIDDLPAIHAQPQLIVASGDLAEWGMKAEFEQAFDFLAQLAERLQLPRERVIVVPGNHDINRKLSEAYFAECAGNGGPPAEPYWPKWKPYAAAFNNFYEGKKSFDQAEPWNWWEFEDLRLIVAGLNSTMVESHQDGTHYGWAGEKQLRWFGDRLRSHQHKGWFRLGVIHHNVLRGAQNDDENLRDADQLTQRLGTHLNLLLHGHTHNSKIGWLSKDLPVLSTGSAALQQNQRPDEVPNQYQLLRLHPTGIERWTRRYDPDQKRWIGDTRCSMDGNHWHLDEKLHFAGVDWGTEEQDDAKREERLTRQDDFLSRVEEVCRLRYPQATVEPRRGQSLDYLRVSVQDGPLSRLFPIGVQEHGLTAEGVERFRQEVFSSYWAADRALQCELVYGGDRLPEDLILREAAHGLRLCRFVEFQGLIDFSHYVRKQTERLAADPIYPPSLYVPQRLKYQIGIDHHHSENAAHSVLEWLREPLARFVLVLGDFGAGKTFLLHELARRIPQEIPHLTPMLIELRQLEKAHNLDQLVAQHLAAADEKLIDLQSFPYMLREGRIALLFDGFDELVSRVTYARATEHLKTLVDASSGKAKVVVTSRTQHFESDQQVKTAVGLRTAHVEPFTKAQIQAFLLNLLRGDQAAANRRFALIEKIQDLLGLSENPRMLSFIAELDEQLLLDAEKKTGHITSGELYRLLIQEKWLTHEVKRVQPKGAAPTLKVDHRLKAVTEVALRLWGKLERSIAQEELAEDVSRTLQNLAELQLDSGQATHMVGSGTLLIRDAEGRFSFVHQSVMEWLVARRAVEDRTVLGRREMSALMASFFCDLSGRDTALTWASDVLQDPEAAAIPKSNAQRVRESLNVTVVALDFRGQDLQGRSFAGQDLSGADFRQADLTGASFERATLISTDFRDSKLDFANLMGAAITDAKFEGASLYRAAALTLSPLSGNFDSFGAAYLGVPHLSSWRRRASHCNRVAFGPSGILASLHGDGSLRLWDAAAGRELHSRSWYQAFPHCVAFSPDGRTLAIGLSDHSVRLCGTSCDQELRVLLGHTDSVRKVAFSFDGSMIASASDDHSVCLWDAASGRALRTLSGHTREVSSVAFSPDGRTLVSGSRDDTVRLWDVASGLEFRILSGHPSSVNDVAFASDGRMLVASGDMTVRVWDTHSGSEPVVIETEFGFKEVAVSPDGRAIASISGQSVRLWEISSGREIRTFSGVSSHARSVAFSPDGLMIASGAESVHVWEIASGRTPHTFAEHVHEIGSVAFHPDGRTLASASADHSVRLWDTTSGRALGALSGHQSRVWSVAFSRDGRTLASASDDHLVCLWDTASGRALSALSGHTGSVLSVAFSSDSRTLASASADSSVRLWDTASGHEIALSGHRSRVWSVAFSPDGRTLASASDDQSVRLWDVASGRKLRAFSGHTGGVLSVVFSPDGRTLASASEDQSVRLWDAASGRKLRALSGHTDSVWIGVFSPDGLTLASASDDHSVRLWDTASGRELRALSGHTAWVRSVSFSPDGRTLASASADGTVRLWSVDSGSLLATLYSSADGWIAVGDNGRYKLSGDIGGAFWYTIGLCRFEVGELDQYLPPGTLQRIGEDDPLW